MRTSDPLENIFRLTPQQKTGLRKLQIFSVQDLLYHLPARYGTDTTLKTIAELTKGERVTVYGRILSQKTKRGWKSKIPMAEMTVEDATGKIKAIWFHQAYMAKKFPPGATVQITGTVAVRDDTPYLSNPVLEEASSVKSTERSLPLGDSGDAQIIPVYPETRGLSSLWFYGHITRLIKEGVLETLVDPIPTEILKKYNLPSLQTALIWAHTPKTASDAEVAKKRFAFEEIFFIQLGRQKMRIEYRDHPTFQIDVSDTDVANFLARFPFAPTVAQKSAIDTIVSDLRRDQPMTRLLEGDVGSGKTAVAATTAYGIVMSRPAGQKYGNLQVAYMAPTEILARQHFESFIEYFRHLPIQIGLITGTECRKFPSKIFDPKKPFGASTHISRTQLLKWVKNGEIPILIGTHALIQKSVEFKHLAYVIIDEQHRFGTMQRGALTKKHATLFPHLLSMTATPIPRTLALTIYGDLDLSLLDQMPTGRKPIITKIVGKTERAKTYEHIREELKAGRQVYVICPRIDEPDPTKELAILAKSATAEAERLQKEIFPEFRIGLVHSKLKPADKESVMKEFTEHHLDILVATSVIEVGVNVPNATTIIIEGAERFGLAQLHQLRGRVIRSNHQAYCYLFTSDHARGIPERLKALATAKNGFELAELDLKLRGSGELSGGKQWGISDIGMEAIQNIKMVEAARTEARTILEKDFELKNYPELKNRLLSQEKLLHLE